MSTSIRVIGTQTNDDFGPVEMLVSIISTYALHTSSRRWCARKPHGLKLNWCYLSFCIFAARLFLPSSLPLSAFSRTFAFSLSLSIFQTLHVSEIKVLWHLLFSRMTYRTHTPLEKAYREEHAESGGGRVTHLMCVCVCAYMKERQTSRSCV